MTKLFEDLDDDETPITELYDAVKRDAPLAERMRPRTLDEYVGQKKIIGRETGLRRAIEGGARLPSLILWGQPGTGKTTLARILARAANADFVMLSAVFSGVKELRAAISEATTKRQRGRHTILFIDEIHRFNKAQQDALLSAVEQGTVTLIGATTENPSFEINGALLSRCRVVALQQLSAEEIETIIKRALSDDERGIAGLNPVLSDDALKSLIAASGGDARVALTALESAVEATESDAGGNRPVTPEAITEALGRARYAYDKGGENHYNLASALIKSIRNSDANAALYWLARLIEGGADPMFIARRLTILASEDIGLADSHALVIANSAASVTHLIGLPEALYPLAHATLYLAQAPKSNTIKRAYFAAVEDANATANENVPLHLRNAITSLMKREGYGANYRYVHTDAAAQNEMRCLPESLAHRNYLESEDDTAC